MAFHPFDFIAQKASLYLETMENLTEKERKPEFHDLRVGDEIYRTTVNSKYTNRKPYQTPNPRLISSFMPGNIQEVFVKQGDKVEAGQRLCTLEAMKMKNIIFAPMQGVIKSINVLPGKMVPKNFVLIEIE